MMNTADMQYQHPFTSLSYAINRGTLRLPLHKQLDAKDGSAKVQE